MSDSESVADPGGPPPDEPALTPDERACFERLRDAYDGPVGRIAELVLQSSSEETNS